MKQVDERKINKSKLKLFWRCIGLLAILFGLFVLYMEIRNPYGGVWLTRALYFSFHSYELEANLEVGGEPVAIRQTIVCVPKMKMDFLDPYLVYETSVSGMGALVSGNSAVMMVVPRICTWDEYPSFFGPEDEQGWHGFPGYYFPLIGWAPDVGTLDSLKVFFSPSALSAANPSIEYLGMKVRSASLWSRDSSDSEFGWFGRGSPWIQRAAGVGYFAVSTPISTLIDEPDIYQALELKTSPEVIGQPLLSRLSEYFSKGPFSPMASNFLWNPMQTGAGIPTGIAADPRDPFFNRYSRGVEVDPIVPFEKLEGEDVYRPMRNEDGLILFYSAPQGNYQSGPNGWPRIRIGGTVLQTTGSYTFIYDPTTRSLYRLRTWSMGFPTNDLRIAEKP